ncbi:unnamed protein product, partial [Durusdinium trenchii]
EAQLPCQLCGRKGHLGRNCPQQMRRKQRRWQQNLAPWRLFEMVLPVRPGTQQLCAILVATSEQAALGRVRAEAGEAAGGAASGKVSASKMFEAWTWVPSVEDVDATVDTAQDLELQAALLASLEAPEAVSHPVQELIAEKKCSKASKAGGR